jgi:hypothetical protein
MFYAYKASFPLLRSRPFSIETTEKGLHYLFNVTKAEL